MAKPHWHIAPYFFVDDVVVTANWYRDKLGFSYERFWGDPPMFCMVRRAGVTIMLSQHAHNAPMRPNNLSHGAWDAYVWMEDADALATEFRSRGVTIARELCDQEYRMRDFDIVDCNGYRICFGHDIS